MYGFADNTDKKKISFTPKVNLQAAVMARLAEKVEKEPRKGGVCPSGKNVGCGLVKIEAEPVIMVEPTVIEIKDSTESTRLVSRKRRRLRKRCCLLCYFLCFAFH